MIGYMQLGYNCLILIEFANKERIQKRGHVRIRFPVLLGHCGRTGPDVRANVAIAKKEQEQDKDSALDKGIYFNDKFPSINSATLLQTT